MRLSILFLTIIWVSLHQNLCAQKTANTQNVFIITLDGLRWQELFGGADDSLTTDTRFVKDTASLKSKYWRSSSSERREILMPWVWNKVAKEGVILGNRNFGNNANVTNMMWFSYPGYNEILVGSSDPNINSNDKKNNPNVTVLEWLHQKPEFKGKVAAFGSWDVFPFIINEERSGIPVNAGFRKADHSMLSVEEKFLNELQDQIPSPWNGVRLDGFTHHYAKSYIKTYKPRLTFISYGETDDFAHDGRYDHYLNAAHNTDRLIADLWDYCQSDPFYKNKTSFIITTDHGRGDQPKKEWTSHGKVIKGSNAIWIMAIGPDTPNLGEIKTKNQYWQNQVAATVAKWLGYEYQHMEDLGKYINEFIFKN